MPNTMAYIEKLFSNPEKRWEFIASCALTFGLDLESLEEILAMDKKIIYSNLRTIVDTNVLEYLFERKCANQEEAKKNFQDFFKRFLWANARKETNKIKTILREISDEEVIKFKNNHEKGQKIDDYELELLIKHQIKYGYTSIKMAEQFDLNANNYRVRVSKFLETHPEYSNAYEAIASFSNKFYLEAHGIKK